MFVVHLRLVTTTKATRTGSRRVARAAEAVGPSTQRVVQHNVVNRVAILQHCSTGSLCEMRGGRGGANGSSRGRGGGGGGSRGRGGARGRGRGDGAKPARRVPHDNDDMYDEVRVELGVVARCGFLDRFSLWYL